ncbi:MAG: hypothetical protein WBP59_06665 [Ilumatobacteraceae bacterium]
MCDLEPGAIDSDSEVSFRISEFAVRSDGERVVLHAERGYSTRSSTGGLWAWLTAETITRGVLTTVLPDEDTGDDHPWEWLAGLARARALQATADDLRRVPYEVVLTDRVRKRLLNGAPSSFEGV